MDTYQLHECNQAGVLRHVSSRGTLASLSHAVIRLVMFMWVCNGAPKWQLLHTNQLLINIMILKIHSSMILAPIFGQTHILIVFVLCRCRGPITGSPCVDLRQAIHHGPATSDGRRQGCLCKCRADLGGVARQLLQMQPER